MLHHSEPCHVGKTLEVGQSGAVVLEQVVEQAAPGGIGQRLEHVIVVIHLDPE